VIHEPVHRQRANQRHLLRLGYKAQDRWLACIEIKNMLYLGRSVINQKED
jgi:hypothetical protein